MRYLLASLVLMSSLLLSCEHLVNRCPAPSPPLVMGMALADLRGALVTVPAASELPPRHHFTLMDQQGREMLGMSVICNADEYLFVFADRRLDKIVDMPETVWIRDAHGAYIGQPTDEASLPEHARSTPSYAVDQWREACRVRQIQSEEARAKHPEPFPAWVNLLAQVGENDAGDRQKHLALMARLDATKLRLGDSARDGSRIFGVAPREMPQTDGSEIDVYGTTERAGWYPVPEVWVYSRNESIYEVRTKYPSAAH